MEFAVEILSFKNLRNYRKSDLICGRKFTLSFKPAN